MDSIFGIYNRNRTRIDNRFIKSDAPHTGVWDNGYVYLERSSVHQPASSICSEPFAHAVIAAGRIDNRDELSHLLNIPRHSSVRDIFARAFEFWHEEMPLHILGDWICAVWDEHNQRMLLMRDHYGYSSLYYYLDANKFVFAVNKRELLNLQLAPVELDELYLAQLMVSWPAYINGNTIYKHIKYLPPAHRLIVESDRYALDQYWSLENTPLLGLKSKDDCVDAFRDAFDKSVAARLVSLDNQTDSNIAISLSGGLDSGSVGVTAAMQLAGQGKRLKAFTWIPISSTEHTTGKRFGNELPYVEKVCSYTGNIDLTPVTAEELSPIDGIRLMLEKIQEPLHAAGNQYWCSEIFRQAVASGCNIMLTGQLGNGGVSWTGSALSQSVFYAMKKLGFNEWFKQYAKSKIPPSLLHTIYKKRYLGSKEHEYQWMNSSAVNHSMAKRLRLHDLYISDSQEMFITDPREMRYRILMPGKTNAGTLHSQMSIAYGIYSVDPTADIRVLQAAISIPDRYFIDPQTGLDRWIIREAMKGRLPDEVRLNPKRGRQAGDVIYRLRRAANQVEEALYEIENGPAIDYVNIKRMRQVWNNAKAEENTQTFRDTSVILLRGIMAGLFINNVLSEQTLLENFVFC